MMMGSTLSSGDKWESALQDLARRLDTQVRVLRYEFPERRRQVGDWWRNKEQWCVHLDSRHYAWFEGGLTVDPSLQRTISWSLEVLGMNQTVKWPDILIEWAMDLSMMTREALFRQVCEGQRLPVGSNLTLKLPGYFICLSIHGAHATSKDADSRALVSEVVEALLPNGWIGWLPDDHEVSMAIVYACSEDMVSSEPGKNDEDEENGAQDDALATVFLLMRQLTQSLEADAMVSCRAAVGALVSREHGIYSGIATAIASWRTRDWIAPSDAVVGWGADPAQTLLLALSPEGLDTFMGVASAKKQTADLTLSAELTETLYGLIDANLNVSEASRLLYLHRNTLMNRIERIRQQTGYDVRVFRDAMTLWLVSAVHRMTQCP